MAFRHEPSRGGRGGFNRGGQSGQNRGSNYGANRGRSQNRIKFMQVDPQMLVKKAQNQEEHIYQSKHAFSEFGFTDAVARNVDAKGYTTPTPIQDQVIPEIMQGHDVVGLASTGTGKTAAFLLPIIHKILENPGQKAIIIAPTRELALQVVDEGKTFARGTDVYFTLLIGGVDIRKQMRQLERNPQVIVGTPGRIKDLTERRQLRLGQYQTIVLDEVDRMLDMGFIHDISEIIDQLPAERHSLFFSATMSPKARQVAQAFLHNPVTVQVAAQSASANVNQDVIRLAGRNRIDVLHDVLLQPEVEKVIVFGRTKHGMEKLSKLLYSRGFNTATIHGNKSQSQRQRALDAFKQNRVNVLLATDVAARGIDIDDVSHVINYELPESYDDYIHRIGRTGRASRTGCALTFID